MKFRMLLATLVVCCLQCAFGQTELIINGDFEAGASPWQFSGTLGANVFNNPSKAHGGQVYLSLGNINNANQAVAQTITIPSNTISATLSFFYNIISANTTDPSADTFNVAIETNGIAVYLFSASGAN